MKNTLRKIFTSSILIVAFSPIYGQTEDSLFVRKIFDEALENGQCYENLRVLCKDIGARVTGSAEAEMAVGWGKKLLEGYGFDTVYLQEIEVPHWERGTKEVGWMINEAGEIHKLHILALGGSIGTNGLIEGEVTEVYTMEDLEALGESIKDKVIFFNQPFDQKLLNTFSAYAGCHYQRGIGTGEAGKLGAKAVVIRSLASSTDHFPHTGSMIYTDTTKKIPGAAISTKDADLLSDWLKKGKVRLKMETDCKSFPNKISHNVIAEIRGKDEKIISFGGHLDSWDVGEGAHDDGAGIVHSIEALRILKKLGYQPNHTLRCVLFMNEENGNFGGKNYARIAKEKKEDHICAIESDRGGFLPIGYSVSGGQKHFDHLKQFQEVLSDFQLNNLIQGFSGLDITPMKKYYPDIFLIGLLFNSQAYFDLHHSEADVFEAVNKRELEMGAATMGTMLYLMDNSLK